MDDAITFFSQPMVSAVLTFLGTVLGAWIKREVDLRQKRLELEALKVTTQIEQLSEQRKRIGQRPTPTSVKLENAKSQLSKSMVGAKPSEIARAIETAVPHAREIVKQVASRSSAPPASELVPLIAVPKRSSASTDGFHAVLADTVPDLKRPSGEIESIGEFGLPKDAATLEDET